MKTKELIRRLQEEDPTGEAEVVAGGEDIYFVECLPMYYDGTPVLLVHDPELRDKAWSIVGLHVPASGSRKLVLHTVDAESAFLSNPDIPVTYDNAFMRQRKEEGLEKLRAEMRAVLANEFGEKP